MFRFKLIAAMNVILFIFGITMVNYAVAGEKFKGHGASTTVKWEQIEVGDEEGHVIALTQSKQILLIFRLNGLIFPDNFEPINRFPD